MPDRGTLSTQNASLISAPLPNDFATADETASELLRLWNAGEQFFPQQMKREIIGLAVSWQALRAERSAE